MNQSVSLEDFEETNKLEVGKLIQLADSGDDSEESRRRFTAQAASIKGLCRTTYQCSAIMARKAETLEETAGVWKKMVAFCDSIILSLRDLANRHPNCGSKHLYDFALDTRNAAARRMELHL